MPSTSLFLSSPETISTSPSFPDNVWLIILEYLAADNAQNLIDLATFLSDHPLGRIAQDFRLNAHTIFRDYSRNSFQVKIFLWK